MSIEEPTITTASGPKAQPRAEIGKPVVFALAAAAGLTVANIYYNQPMLGLMARDLPGRAITYVPTATQLGYAAGLIVLVPLGDLVERKRLIVLQCLALTVALALVAVAPSAGQVLAASLGVGLLASVAQQIVPFAANLAPDERRGAVVGTVMAGLLCGILLSRTLAGLVAGLFGWREMFWLAVPLLLATVAMMAVMLPRSRPQPTDMTYGGLIASLWGLWREFPALRRATYAQCCQFGVFSVFWTILALRLQEPQFGLGPEAAGLVVGVLVLDAAVQLSQISNQSIIYALRPEARSRINTVYMAIMFLAGAACSGAATAVWHGWGWSGVSALGIAISVVGLGLQALRPRTKAPEAA